MPDPSPQPNQPTEPTHPIPGLCPVCSISPNYHPWDRQKRSVFCAHRRTWAVWQGDHWEIRGNVSQREMNQIVRGAELGALLIATSYEAGHRAASGDGNALDAAAEVRPPETDETLDAADGETP